LIIIKSTIVIVVLFLTSLISVQDCKVNGLVLDGEFNNELLAFVTVTVKETGKSISTDLDGKYSLNICLETYTLVFDFVGYKSVEVTYTFTNAKNANPIYTVLYARELTINIASND
jgi:hypothetical protein